MYICIYVYILTYIEIFIWYTPCADAAWFPLSPATISSVPEWCVLFFHSELAAKAAAAAESVCVCVYDCFYLFIYLYSYIYMYIYAYVYMEENKSLKKQVGNLCLSVYLFISIYLGISH